jgi:hypothetical protein
MVIELCDFVNSARRRQNPDSDLHLVLPG